MFMVAVFAECSRLPFDLLEAEQELVGGYHTEYSALKLGLMLLSEYVHLIAGSFMLSVMFLGGWSLFGLETVSDDPNVAALLRSTRKAAFRIILSPIGLLCREAMAQSRRWS